MLRSIFLIVASLASALALAHHSGAAVEMNRTETISGTVKEFLWANPHCWIYVLVEADDGTVEEWGIEGPPVMGMAKSGMRKTSLKPGDRVEVVFNPRKDGKHGGGFRAVTLLETGETFGAPTLPPPPAPGQANEN